MTFQPGSMSYVQANGSAPNAVAFPFISNRAPTTSDNRFPVGQRWVDTVGGVTYDLTKYTSSNGILSASWSAGGNAPATTAAYGTVLLTDNSQPVATKFYADNLAIAGAPAWSEVISGIGQLATNAEAVAGLDDTVAMTPLKTAAVFATPPAIGSGTPAAGSFAALICTTLNASGLATLSASATITTGATALNLGADASTGAINLGTGAGARTLTLGNVTGATAVAINTGTGGFTLTTTGAGDAIINSADTVLIDSAGVLELNSSAGVIGIGNDAVAQAINVGTGAAARTITLGNSSGATSLVLNAGTGAINVGTNAIAHTVTIGNSTGATSVVIDSGTGAINVGTNAVAHTVTIGNVTGATAVAVNAGSGGVAVTATNSAIALQPGTGALNLATAAAANATTIGNSTGASSVAINCGTGALNLGTNAVAHTVTLGNVTGATAVAINTGTGGFLLTTTGSGDAVINSADTVLIDSAGVLELNSSAGVIGIGNDAVAQNINVGTGAAARVITIGNVTGATQVVVNAGTAASSFNTTNGAFALVTGTGAISLSADAAATTVNIGTGAAVVKTISIGGTGANVITIGDTQTAGSVSIGAAMTGGTLNIGSTAAGTGTCTFLGGTGVQTCNFMASTGVKTLNIATGAAANVVTIGTETGAASLALKAGSGGVNVSGNLNLANVATKLSYNGGAATDFIGTGTLVGGTLLIANTNIAASDRIFLSRTAANASVTLGELTYTISAGASFTVTSKILGTPASDQVADVSSFAYFIVGQT